MLYLPILNSYKDSRLILFRLIKNNIIYFLKLYKENNPILKNL